MITTSLLFTLGSIAASQERQNIPLPNGIPKRPIGIEAINIRSGANPPFSPEDVLNYLRSSKIPKLSFSPDKLSINSLEFVTSAEASKRLNGVVVGLNDNELVGLATFSGGIVASGPPGGKQATFNSGYAIFDATTGNLLLIGTL
jgi:hypothetical protein